MKNWKHKGCIALAFILALAAVLLPSVKYVQQAQANRHLLEKMEQNLAALGEEQLEKHRNLARWYNYHLDLGASGLDVAYGSILNVADGAMAVLEVPQLHMRLPVFHGEQGAVGHLPDSHFPIGGRTLHTVLRIQESYDWRIGMAVYIDCLGQRTMYRVESIQVMGAGWPAQWPSELERLTVLHDRGGQRTIIRCVRCSELTVRPQEKLSYLPEAVLIAMSVFSPVIMTYSRIRKKLRGLQNRKYHGFSRKNSRKTELL
jgi:sortase (surface protein transpeptidase)